MIKKLILLVDDNEDIRTTVADVLTICDYEVLLAENGKEALRILSQQGS